MRSISTGPMAGQTVLVTGGTGGIGKATAIGLAAMGARVGITGRDIARTHAAAAEVAVTSGNLAVDPFPADMSSQAEVRRLAGEVLAAYPRLDVLINNAGGFWATRRITAGGLEHTFAVNHLAPFLLTRLLLDRLTASAPARIVTVSSGAHATGTINFDDLQGGRRYSGQQAYGQSKLANIMFTYELARRLDGTGVTATVLHPGVVRTRFAAEDPSPTWKAFLPLMQDGHPGTTLAQVAKADREERHEPGWCSRCGAGLAGRPVTGIERRQVFDLPPVTVTVTVTEHQLIERQCGCGHRARGAAPEGAEAPGQHRPRIAAVIIPITGT